MAGVAPGAYHAPPPSKDPRDDAYHHDAEQFRTLVLQAEGVLVAMKSDPESDPVSELLARQILDDLTEHLPVQ